MPIELTTKDRARFEKFVDRSGGPDACHPWTGCCNKRGYGKFYLDGHVEKAHRVAWVAAGHEITEDKPHVLHDCPGGDLAACCNERHLWDGTPSDNLRDMAMKGRGRRSELGLPFGVILRPSGRFGANIYENRKLVWLGIYDTAEEAAEAAMRAKRLIYE